MSSQCGSLNIMVLKLFRKKNGSFLRKRLPIHCTIVRGVGTVINHDPISRRVQHARVLKCRRRRGRRRNECRAAKDVVRKTDFSRASSPQPVSHDRKIIPSVRDDYGGVMATLWRGRGDGTRERARGEKHFRRKHMRLGYDILILLYSTVFRAGFSRGAFEVYKQCVRVRRHATVGRREEGAWKKKRKGCKKKATKGL